MTPQKKTMKPAPEVVAKGAATKAATAKTKAAAKGLAQSFDVSTPKSWLRLSRVLVDSVTLTLSGAALLTGYYVMEGGRATESRLNAEQVALSEQIQTMGQTMENMAIAPPPVEPDYETLDSIDELQREIADLRDELTSVKNSRESTPRPDTAVAEALLAQVVRNLRDGEAYAEILSRLEILMPQASRLKEWAVQPPPSTENLLAEISHPPREAPVAETKVSEGDEDWWSRVVLALSDQVTIEKVSGEKVENEKVVSALVQAASRGDLSAALSAAQADSTPDARLIAWMADATARLAADAVLADVLASAPRRKAQ